MTDRVWVQVRVPVTRDTMGPALHALVNFCGDVPFRLRVYEQYDIRTDGIRVDLFADPLDFVPHPVTDVFRLRERTA